MTTFRKTEGGRETTKDGQNSSSAIRFSHMTNELQVFVKEALAKNVSRTKIHEMLVAGGWAKDEVDNALASYLDVDFPVPVPKRRPYLSAREAFLYLLMFATLYISAISLGTLIFQYLNIWLPDVTTQYYDYGTKDTIRNAASSIIITFPIFLFVASILKKSIQKDAEKRSSKIRKWLTYITLLIAAGVIIGDLIALVNALLGGTDATPRFLLKVLTILLIAGSTFGYYLNDLRGEEKER